MTKTVDNHTSQNTYEIPGKWKESVQAIVDLGGVAVGLDNIAEQRGVTKQAVSKHFPEIIEQGILTKEGSKKPFTYKLNGEGYRAISDTPYGAGSVDNTVDSRAENKGKGSNKLVRRLHGLTAVAQVQRGEVMPEKWMGRMKDEERVHRTEGNGVNDACVWTNRFYIRLHKQSCTVQVREGCSFKGDSSIEVFLNYHEELQNLLEWVERATKVSMQLDVIDLRHAELAFEGHHLAQLVKKIPDLDMNDFFVEDDDLGKEVLTLDDSFGAELESMSGERAEEVGSAVEGQMRQLANNPRAVKRGHNLENEMQLQDVSGQEMVHSVRMINDVAGTMQESVQEVKQVKDEISDMKQVLKDNKRTREALHEQVRAINELAQRNQELIEGQVQEEEDEESDIVEETIRDVLNDDCFSRPGLQYGHLMAWRDGSCVKLLDKSVVENSDSEFVELVDQWKP